MLEKAVTIKRLEYSPLGKELKKQTSVAEKQYHGLNKIFKPDEKEETITIKKKTPEIPEESNLIYGSKYNFSEYRNYKKYSGLSFMKKYDKLFSFYHRLNDFRNFAPQTAKTNMKKEIVYKILFTYIIKY